MENKVIYKVEFDLGESGYPTHFSLVIFDPETQTLAEFLEQKEKENWENASANYTEGLVDEEELAEADEEDHEEIITNALNDVYNGRVKPLLVKDAETIGFFYNDGGLDLPTLYFKVIFNLLREVGMEYNTWKYIKVLNDLLEEKKYSDIKALNEKFELSFLDVLVDCFEEMGNY